MWKDRSHAQSYLNQQMRETCSCGAFHHFLGKSDRVLRAAAHMMQTLLPCILKRNKNKQNKRCGLFQHHYGRVILCVAYWPFVFLSASLALLNAKWTGSYIVFFYSTWVRKVLYTMCCIHLFTQSLFLCLSAFYIPLTLWMHQRASWGYDLSYNCSLFFPLFLGLSV